MSMKIGLFLFGKSLESQEQELIQTFLINPNFKKKLANSSDLLILPHDEAAVGYYQDKTLLFNLDVCYECISHLEFLPKIRALQALETYSSQMDILLIYSQTNANIYGHCLYSGGKKVANYLSIQDRSEEEMKIDENTPKWYHGSFDDDNETTFYTLFKDFFGEDFNTFLDKAPNFTVYSTA